MFKINVVILITLCLTSNILKTSGTIRPECKITSFRNNEEDYYITHLRQGDLDKMWICNNHQADEVNASSPIHTIVVHDAKICKNASQTLSLVCNETTKEKTTGGLNVCLVGTYVGVSFGISSTSLLVLLCVWRGLRRILPCSTLDDTGTSRANDKGEGIQPATTIELSSTDTQQLPSVSKKHAKSVHDDSVVFTNKSTGAVDVTSNKCQVIDSAKFKNYRNAPDMHIKYASNKNKFVEESFSFHTSNAQHSPSEAVKQLNANENIPVFGTKPASAVSAVGSQKKIKSINNHTVGICKLVKSDEGLEKLVTSHVVTQEHDLFNADKQQTRIDRQDLLQSCQRSYSFTTVSSRSPAPTYHSFTTVSSRGHASTHYLSSCLQSNSIRDRLPFPAHSVTESFFKPADFLSVDNLQGSSDVQLQNNQNICSGNSQTMNQPMFPGRIDNSLNHCAKQTYDSSNGNELQSRQDFSNESDYSFSTASYPSRSESIGSQDSGTYMPGIAEDSGVSQSIGEIEFDLCP